MRNFYYYFHIWIELKDEFCIFYIFASCNICHWCLCTVENAFCFLLNAFRCFIKSVENESRKKKNGEKWKSLETTHTEKRTHSRKMFKMRPHGKQNKWEERKHEKQENTLKIKSWCRWSVSNSHHCCLLFGYKQRMNSSCTFFFLFFFFSSSIRFCFFSFQFCLVHSSFRFLCFFGCAFISSSYGFNEMEAKNTLSRKYQFSANKEII